VPRWILMPLSFVLAASALGGSALLFCADVRLVDRRGKGWPEKVARLAGLSGMFLAAWRTPWPAE